jgi:hypothetical protein
MSRKLLSIETIEKDDWLIKISKYKDYILLVVVNVLDGTCIIQHTDDEYKANLIIEYIIEKGEL